MVLITSMMKDFVKFVISRLEGNSGSQLVEKAIAHSYIKRGAFGGVTTVDPTRVWLNSSADMLALSKCFFLESTNSMEPKRRAKTAISS